MAHTVVRVSSVTPLRVPPEATVAPVKLTCGHDRGWQELAVSDGTGDHVLVAGPLAVHVYVSAVVVLLPPPME